MRGLDEINWSTPKRIQMEKERAPRNAYRPKTRSKYCKKLKGPHKGEWKPWMIIHNIPTEYEELICIGCGKKLDWRTIKNDRL